MRKQGAAAAVTAGLVAVLAGCGGGDGTTTAGTTSEPAATREAVPTAEPTPTVEPEAAGTQAQPLPAGESHRISAESAWSVALVSDDLDAAAAIRAADPDHVLPAEGETFVVATFAVTIDAAAMAAQGMDIADGGVHPMSALLLDYVAADGTAYYAGTDSTACYTDAEIHLQPALHADGETLTGDQCIAVPTDQVAGGAWRVGNLAGDELWFRS